MLRFAVGKSEKYIKVLSKGTVGVAITPDIGGKKMAEKVAKVGVKKARGYLYFVDKKGNVARAKMARGGGKKGRQKQEIVAKAGAKKVKGYLYFVDKNGDISRAKMARGGKKRRKKKRKKAKKKATRKKKRR